MQRKPSNMDRIKSSWRNRHIVYFIFIFTVFISGGYLHAQKPVVSFSAESAKQHFETGKKLYLKGDLSSAIKQFNSALRLWPVHQPSWHWLAASFQHLNQIKDYKFAIFFRERTSWALEVDLRHARRIFADIASGKTETVRNDPAYINAAKGLIIFYDYAICRVEVARERELAKKLNFNQEYGLEALFGLAPDPNKRRC